MKSLLTLVSLIALAVGSARARSTTDLSLFKGKYQGSTVVLLSGSGTFTGPASLAFNVKPSGKAGTLSVVGSFSGGGSTFDMSNAFQFFANHAVTIAKVAPPFVATSVSGTYRSTTRTIQASGVFSTVQFSLTCKVKQTGHKATLTAVYTLTSSGSVVYQITYTGTRHVK
jgi:hypothetical protein